MRNARMRENIGQYVDACAELGVPQRELFITADLFENKNWAAVLKSIHGLARVAHYDVDGFAGPHIGIRKHGRIAGDGSARASALEQPSSRSSALSAASVRL